MALDERVVPIAGDDRVGGFPRRTREEALLVIKHVPEHPEISIAGDIDTATASRLREAVELSIEGSPCALTIDGRGIGRVGIAGLNALADAVAACRERGIELDLALSPQARSLLDRLGLWWLGVIDTGPALDAAIRDARLAYGQLLNDEPVSEPAVELQ